MMAEAGVMEKYNWQELQDGSLHGWQLVCDSRVGADLRPLHLIRAPHGMVAEWQERMFQQIPVEATQPLVS